MGRRILLKRLIEFVVSGGGGTPVKLTLQDIALCRMWYEGQTRQGVENDSTQAVWRRVTSWIEAPDIPDLNTAGRRHQNLLRMLLDRLVGGDGVEFAPDEITFLYTACDLVERSKADGAFARLKQRLDRHRPAITKRQAQATPTNDVHQLERHIQYAAESDIRRATVSAIRLLAGIELPCRGPVFRAGNNLRILGDIPDNCTVVVENEGFCSVDGYVMGRILAKSFCEIRHNISGVAIVLHGHIRARGIINNAQVISKMGSVFCINAQGPKLVFAGRSIEVLDRTMLGKFITREMNVAEEVRGSHIEIAGAAQAKQFRHLGMSSVNIVLRRELSCEDYGEVTGDELKQLLSHAYSLRRNARNFRSMEEAAWREANHTAQSILMYIFGGGEIQKRLQGFLHAQRRHTLVSNVVDNLQNILAQAQDGLSDSITDDSELPPSVADGEDEPEDDQELIGAQADTKKLQQSLRVRNLNRTQRTMILEEARLKLTEMLALQRTTAEKMKEEEKSIQHLEQYEQVLSGSGEGATKIDVLNRLLPAMRKQPAESTIGVRLRSNFIARALRTVERAVRHRSEFGEKAEQYLQDFRAVSERLGKDYQIRVLENPESEEESARITGVFESGTRIYMDFYVENMADASRDAVLTTTEDHGVRTYIRANSGGGFRTSERD